MILLDTFDNIITIALSTKDMTVAPTQMIVKNVQSKQETQLQLVDVSTIERTGICRFYVIRDPNNVPSLTDVTFITLPDGTYEYTFGEEIGLLQIGIPTLQKTEYTTQENNIVYNG